MNAREFCIMAHEGQKRKYSGAPFHVHPLSVARIISESSETSHSETSHSEVLNGALLHDVLEDTKYTVHDLRDAGFSEGVITLVVECTNVYSKCQLPRKLRKQLETRRIASITPDAKTIKLADSIHNINDFIKQDPEYARNVYLPEKRILLDEALVGGDKTLWDIADNIIKNFYKK